MQCVSTCPHTQFSLRLCHKCYPSSTHNYMMEIYKHRIKLNVNVASFIGKRRKLWNQDSSEFSEIRMPTRILNKTTAGGRAAGSCKSTQVMKQHVPLWAQYSHLQSHNSPLWCCVHDSMKSLKWFFTVAVTSNHLVLPLSFESRTHDLIRMTSLPRWQSVAS